LETEKDEPDGFQPTRILLHDVMQGMATAYNRLGDLETAISYLRKGFECIPSCYQCPYVIVAILFTRFPGTRVAEIMDLLKSMDNKLPGKEDRQIVEFLMDDMHESDWDRVFLAAARNTGDQKFLAKAYHDTMIAAKKH
jgi:hypothetical protein